MNLFGKNNLPHNLVTKESYREFTSCLITLGQLNPNAKPENLLPNISRKTFTKHFIEYSDKKFKEKLKIFKNKAGSCL